MRRHILSLIYMAVFSFTLLNGDESFASNFSTIAENITESIEELPGLLTGVSYLMGLLLGVLGILKVKDHVENPTQTPLKDGAIRLASGGALFGLPIVYEAMLNTIGTTLQSVEPATLNAVEFAVR
jgi:hypothetical protein